MKTEEEVLQMTEIIQSALINVGKFDKAKRAENLSFVMGVLPQNKGISIEGSNLKIDLYKGLSKEKDLHLKVMDLINGHVSEIQKDPATNHKIMVVNLLKPRN